MRARGERGWVGAWGGVGDGTGRGVIGMSTTSGTPGTVGRGGEGRRGLALFLCFAGFYLLGASGHFYAVDEETLYRMTEGIVERGSFALPSDVWGALGKRRGAEPFQPQFPPGQPLVAMPLYLLGRALATLFPPDARGYVLRFCVALLGPLVGAATVALLYRLGRALGYRGGAALALAAIYGLATMAWPHGRTFFAEPLAAFLLLAAFYGLLRGTTSGVNAPVGWLVAAGAAAAAAVATKPHAAIALPPLGLYLLLRAPALAAPGSAGGDWPVTVQRIAGAAILWGAGLALVAAPLAAFNAATYGGALRTGYGTGPRGLFTIPPLTGLYGLLLSPGKGILWYAPPVLLAALAWWPFFRRRRAEALACLGVVAAHLAFYSRYRFWHGDGAWGPRYLAIALPFALLPLVAWVDGLRARRALRGLTALVVALGVGVQLLGAAVNFDWYIQRSDERARHFSPPASPIPMHARILGARVEEWLLRAFPPADGATLTRGFGPAESDYASESLFPRWTDGAGEIALRAAGREPVLVKLTFFDHRPPALRRGQAAVLVGGVPLPAGSVERRDFSGTGEGWVYQFSVPPAVPGEATTVVLRSAAWNPRTAGAGERDEQLGVFVHNVEAWQAGRGLPVREALAIGPLPPGPREGFYWFNNDSPRHLIDHWAWYAALAGLGPNRTVAWIVAYAIASGALLAAGLRLGLRALPPGLTRGAAWPLRRKGARRRHGARATARPRDTAGHSLS